MTIQLLYIIIPVLCRPTFPIAEDMIGQDMVLYSSLMFYAVLPLAPAIALIPVLIYKW